jgi:hypothetical protein
LFVALLRAVSTRAAEAQANREELRRARNDDEPEPDDQESDDILDDGDEGDYEKEE